MRIYTCKVSPASPTNPQVPHLAVTLAEHPETDNGVLDEIIRDLLRRSVVNDEKHIASQYPASVVYKDRQSGQHSTWRFPHLINAVAAARGLSRDAQAVLFFERDLITPTRIFTHTLTVIKFGESITWNSLQP